MGFNMKKDINFHINCRFVTDSWEGVTNMKMPVMNAHHWHRMMKITVFRGWQAMLPGSF